MASNISFNPFLTTVAANTFSVQSDGYMQGVAMDDPAIRNTLSGGPLATTETLPMWGGIAIQELLSAVTVDSSLGNQVARATTVAQITGFSVYNQAHNWVTTPQSRAPSAGAGMSVPFHRIGSGARIAVACDPSLVSLNGGLITQQVSWDFNNQRLQPYDAATATVSITSQTATFNATSGVWTVAVVAAAATTVGAVGDAINISGATNSGTGGNGLVNGNQIVTAFTDSQHFSYSVTAPAGAIGTIAGTQVLNEGIGAVNVRVLNVSVGNSKIVTYDSVNNYVNWNPSGTCALILI